MIDTSQLDAFARKCEAAVNDLKPYAAQFLDDMGEEFLDICQESIQEQGNVDTGKLLASFTKGGAGNIYQLDAGALVLTVGTNIEYAQWVNDGHSQQPGRFVPGYWSGGHFRYSPGAGTGMVLKASFVMGSHFFERSIQTLQAIFPSRADRAFDQFFRRYFS